jgi:hypothetical protein
MASDVQLCFPHACDLCCAELTSSCMLTGLVTTPCTQLCGCHLLSVVRAVRQERCRWNALPLLLQLLQSSQQILTGSATASWFAFRTEVQRLHADAAAAMILAHRPVQQMPWQSLLPLQLQTLHSSGTVPGLTQMRPAALCCRSCCCTRGVMWQASVVHMHQQHLLPQLRTG